MSSASPCSILVGASWPEGGQVFHGTSVARGDRGLLILGPSGYGKSRLALDLMALGAVLISDDRTIVRAGGVASAPPQIQGQIEVRGLGLMQVPSQPAPLVAAIDLGKVTKDRLPPTEHVDIVDHRIRFFHKPLTGALASALWLYLGGYDIT